MLKSIFLAVILVLIFSLAAQAAKWVIHVDICEATNGSKRITSTQPGGFHSKRDCEAASKILLNVLKSTNMKIFYLRCTKSK